MNLNDSRKGFPCSLSLFKVWTGSPLQYSKNNDLFTKPSHECLFILTSLPAWACCSSYLARPVACSISESGPAGILKIYYENVTLYTTTGFVFLTKMILESIYYDIFQTYCIL